MRHVGESSTATTSREPPRLGRAESVRAPGGAARVKEGPASIRPGCGRRGRGCELGPTGKRGTRRSSATSRSSGQTRTSAELRGSCRPGLTIRAVRATTTVSFSAHRRDELKRKMSCPSPVPSEEAPLVRCGARIASSHGFGWLHSFAWWRLRAEDDILFRSSFRRLVEPNFWTLV
jgi:hypothetical protein